MGWFSKKQPHELIRGYKDITVNGMVFRIKKLNPFLDFPSDRIPQIFTDYSSTKTPLINADTIKKSHQDMQEIVRAGVVNPELKPNGSKGSLTPEDLFRDPSMGVKLYFAILNHSLNHFKGLNKLFFSIGIRLSCLMFFASGMVKDLAVFSFPKEKSA